MITIPSVPLTPLVDSRGEVTNPWRIYFDQLSGQLQSNLLVTFQELTTSEINAIPSGERNGLFIYDTDTSELKFGFNDTFSVVNTS